MATVEERLTLLEQQVAQLIENEGRVLHLIDQIIGLQRQLIGRFNALEAKMDRDKEEILEAFQRGFTTNY